MATSDRMVSHGANLVGALVTRLGAAEVARRVESSDTMVRRIASGERTPSANLKKRFSKLGVELSAWTTPALVTPEPRLPEAVSRAAKKVEREQRTTTLAGDVEKGSAIAKLVASVAEWEELIEEARNEKPPAPYTHVAALKRGMDNALDKLAGLRGEGEITTAAIRRSKAWQELLSTIERVLQKHPEAARDFTEAFAKLT